MALTVEEVGRTFEEKLVGPRLLHRKFAARIQRFTGKGFGRVKQTLRDAMALLTMAGGGAGGGRQISDSTLRATVT